MWLSLAPERSADLFTVARWAAEWLRGGHPYTTISNLVDYPPWALVVFAPLGLFANSATLPFVWVAANLALLAVIVHHLLTFVDDDDPRCRVRLALLIAACAASRTLGQFSVFSFACALVAVTGGDDWWHACLLGLSLVKPQIGGVVWVWAFLERRWRFAGRALLVPAILFVVFCARSGDAPVSVVTNYVLVLTELHGGDLRFSGHTEVIPWILAVIPHATGLGAKLVAALILLLPALIASARGGDVRARQRMERLALCGAVSLLVMRHLSYDLILLFPLLVAWRAWPCSAEPRSRLDRVAFWVIAALLVVEPAAWWRHFSTVGAIGAVLDQLDRVFVALVWLVLAWRSVRSSKGGFGLFNRVTTGRQAMS